MDQKETVQEIIRTFAENDLEGYLLHFCDDVRFIWPGAFEIGPGKDAVRKFFEVCPEVLESEIGELIEEGNRVVGTGMVTTRHDDGSIRKSLFSDIYEFEDGKVKTLTSYVVFQKPDQ